MLAVRSDRRATVMLNRNGTVQVHGRDDGEAPTWTPLEWTEVVRSDPRELVVRLEAAAGLPAVGRSARTTGRVLVYRTLSALANLSLLSKPAEITMGFIDSAGYDGGPAPWLNRFPELEHQVTGRNGRPERGFDFWQVTGSEVAVAFDVSTSDAWATDGRRIDLAKLHNNIGRSMPRLLAAVLELGSTASSR